MDELEFREGRLAEDDLLELLTGFEGAYLFRTSENIVSLSVADYQPFSEQEIDDEIEALKSTEEPEWNFGYMKADFQLNPMMHAYSTSYDRPAELMGVSAVDTSEIEKYLE